MLLPLNTQGADAALFATYYPEQDRWLREHGDFQVSVYRWPEFLARIMCDRIGMTVWEFEVRLTAELADAFARVFG